MRVEGISAAEQLAAAQARVRELESALRASVAPCSGGGCGTGMHVSASAASLSDLGGEGGAGEEVLVAMKRRMALLKASRDKLIAALDSQVSGGQAVRVCVCVGGGYCKRSSQARSSAGSPLQYRPRR